MNEGILNSLVNEIGEYIDGNVNVESSVLIYAEFEDGFVTSNIFLSSLAGVVCQKCSEQLVNILHSHWEKSCSVDGNESWFSIAFFWSDNKFSIDVKYPNEVDLDEFITDRRPRVIKKFYNNIPITYS